jgi:VCBS repeat protein
VASGRFGEVWVTVSFPAPCPVDLLACGHPIGTTTKWPCAAFHNDGKGNFTDVTLQVLGPNPPAFETPGDYCVADFNGDGRADVFITNTIDCCGFPGGQNALLLQTADGRLEDVTATNLPQQLTDTQRVACGDIDGAGHADLYLANFAAASGPPPQIYLNDGRGHFTVGDSSRLPAILQQFSNYAARFIDVNNGGRLDLFSGALDTWDNQAHDLLLLNDGHGFFTPAPDNALPTRYGGRDWGTLSSRVVDLDGDGWPDLINTVYAPNYSEGAIQILLNDRDGTFRDATDLILQPAWQRNGSLSSDPWRDRLRRPGLPRRLQR